jgi:hypothetical protein
MLGRVLFFLLLLLPAASAWSQQFLYNDATAGPICSGPFGPGPCAVVMQYLQQCNMPGPDMAGLPNAGALPRDAQIVAMIDRRCKGLPGCMAAACGAVEIQRCRIGMFPPSGCFGPNGDIMQVLNRVLP